MSYGVTGFELEVQSLATDLHRLEVGESVGAAEKMLAEQIALYMSDNRSDLRAEYGSNQTATLLDTLHSAVKAAQGQTNFSRDPDVYNGLLSLEADIQAQDDRRRLIGGWVLDILPKGERTQLNAMKIIRSLLSRDDLVLNGEDANEAEEYIQFTSSEQVPPTEVKAEAASFDPNNLFDVSSHLIRILLNASKNGVSMSKIELYKSKAFRSLPCLALPDEEIKKAFHEAWSFIGAWYEDIDPSFNLFEHSGNTKGRKYILNEPELVEEFWDFDEEIIEEVDDVDEETEQVPKIVSVSAKGLVFNDGSFRPFADEAQKLAFHELLSAGAEGYVSVKNVVHKASELAGFDKSSAETSVKSFYSAFSAYLERFYSRRRGKNFVRLLPEHRIK